MAYVRITEDLKDTIRAKIGAMQRDATATYKIEAPAPGTELNAQFLEEAHKALWSAHPEMRGITPDDWCVQSTETSLTLREAGGNREVNIRLEAPLVAPPNADIRHRRSIVVLTKGETPPEVMAWFENAATALAEQEQVAQTFRNVDHQVNTFLGTQASLNAALKAMPELENYVPQRYLDRVNQQVERRTPTKKADVEAIVDRDALVSLAAAHRITQSMK